MFPAQFEKYRLICTLKQVAPNQYITHKTDAIKNNKHACIGETVKFTLLPPILHSAPKLFEVLYPFSGKFVAERLFENG